MSEKDNNGYKKKNYKNYKNYKKPYKPTVAQARKVLEEYTKNWDSYAVQYADILGNQINSASALYQPLLGQDYTNSVSGSEYIPEQATLKEWVKDPYNYQQQLRGVSKYFENVIMQYNRLTDYFSRCLMFRYELRSVKSPKKQEEIKQWEVEYNNCLEWLKKFNVPFQCTNVMDKTMNEGGGFYYLREGKDFNTLIEIPSDWCYVTGKWDLGFTYAINLAFFDKMINLRSAIPELYRYYRKFIRMRESGLQGRMLANYQYYPVPVKKGFVFTFNLLENKITPPFAGLFKDALAITEYKDLLKAKAQLDTWRMIAQIIPKDKDNKPVIPQKTVEKFIQNTQVRLPSGAITFATPMDVKEISFGNAQSQNNLIGLGESLFYRSAGVNGAILDGGDKTAPVVKASLANDFGYVKHMYDQFENFINIQLKIKCCSEFEFRIKMYGNRYTHSDDVKQYSELVAKNNMPVKKLFALDGYEPFEIEGELFMEEYFGYKDRMKPLISAFNTKDAGEGNDQGRPEKKTELTDSGAEKKTYSGNKK